MLLDYCTETGTIIELSVWTVLRLSDVGCTDAAFPFGPRRRAHEAGKQTRISCTTESGCPWKPAHLDTAAFAARIRRGMDFGAESRLGYLIRHIDARGSRDRSKESLGTIEAGDLLDSYEMPSYRWIYDEGPRCRWTLRSNYRHMEQDARLRLARAAELYTSLCAEDPEDQQNCGRRCSASTSARPALPDLKSSVRRLRAALAELSYEDLAVVTRVSGYCFGRVYSTQSMRARRLSGCLHVVRYPEITARHAGWHWQQGAESRAHGLHDHRVRRSGRRIAVRWFRSIQCKTPSDTDVRGRHRA